MHNDAEIEKGKLVFIDIDSGEKTVLKKECEEQIHCFGKNRVPLSTFILKEDDGESDSFLSECYEETKNKFLKIFGNE